MIDYIKEEIKKSILIKELFLEQENSLSSIEEIVELVVTAFKNDCKVLFCGNGGSAADSQHLSAELSGRFKIDRTPLDAEALHVNSSYITAVANDYGYDQIFSRLVEAKGKPGDVLFGLSTSGNSKNIINAFKVAKIKKLKTIAFTGKKTSQIEQENLADVLIKVPSEETARIQECHIMIGHIICDLVEKKLFVK